MKKKPLNHRFTDFFNKPTMNSFATYLLNNRPTCYWLLILPILSTLFRILSSNSEIQLVSILSENQLDNHWKLIFSIFLWLSFQLISTIFRILFGYQFTQKITESYKKKLRPSAMNAIKTLNPNEVQDKYSDARNISQDISNGENAIDNVLSRVSWFTEALIGTIGAFHFLWSQSPSTFLIMILLSVPIGYLSWRDIMGFKKRIY